MFNFLVIPYLLVVATYVSRSKHHPRPDLTTTMADTTIVSASSSASPATSSTGRSVAGTSSHNQTASWVVSFDNLLNDNDGIAAFAAFLEKEYSAENIHFWMDCQKLRKMTNAKEIRRMVKHMYGAYFAQTAPQPINVDSHARTGADADILDPSNQSFRLAECQVYSLMRDDSYARFLRSDLFANRVKQEIGSTVPSSSSSSTTSSLKKDKGGDHGIVSWYKTSLRPRLSRSVKKSKRPKSVNLGNIQSTSSSSLPGSSTNIGVGIVDNTHRFSGDESDTQSSSCNRYTTNTLPSSSNPSFPSSSSCQHHHHQQATTSSLPSTILESPKTPPRSSSSGDDGGRSDRKESLSRFTISPLSPFNLSNECQFEEFFAQVVSCSQKVPHVDQSTNVGDQSPMSQLKFTTNIFHSQPCLPELHYFDQEEQMGDHHHSHPHHHHYSRLTSSPSLHDVFDSNRNRRKQHHIHGHHPTPPPPIPPKTTKQPYPPPPPPSRNTTTTTSTTIRRNIHSYEELFV